MNSKNIDKYYLKGINDIAPNTYNKSKNQKKLKINYKEDYIFLNKRSNKKWKLKLTEQHNPNHNIFQRYFHIINNSNMYNLLEWLLYILYLYLIIIINFNEFKFLIDTNFSINFIYISYIFYAIFFIFIILKYIFLKGVKKYFFGKFKNKFEFLLIILYFFRQIYYLQIFRIFLFISILQKSFLTYWNFKVVIKILLKIFYYVIINFILLVFINFWYSVFYLNLLTSNYIYFKSKIMIIYENNIPIIINNKDNKFNLKISFLETFEILVSNKLYTRDLTEIINDNYYIYWLFIIIKQLWYLLINFLPLIIFLLNYKNFLWFYHNSVSKNKFEFNILADITKKLYENKFNKSIKNFKIIKKFEKILFSKFVKILDYLIVIIYFILLNIYIFYNNSNVISSILFSINILNLWFILILLFFIKISKHLTHRSFTEELILSIIIIIELIFNEFSYFYIFRLFKLFVWLRIKSLNSIIDLLKKSLSLVITLIIINILFLYFLIVLLKILFININIYYVHNINSYPVIFYFNNNIRSLISVCSIIFSEDWVYLYHYLIYKKNTFNLIVLILIIYIFRIIFLNFLWFLIFINFKYGIHKTDSNKYFQQIYNIKRKETLNRSWRRRKNNKVQPKIRSTKDINNKFKESFFNVFNNKLNLENDVNNIKTKNYNINYNKTDFKIKIQNNKHNTLLIPTLPNKMPVLKEKNIVNNTNNEDNYVILKKQWKKAKSNPKSHNNNFINETESKSLNYSFLMSKLTNFKYLEDEKLKKIKDDQVKLNKSYTSKSVKKAYDFNSLYLYNIKEYKIHDNNIQLAINKNQAEFGKYFNYNFYYILLNYWNSNNNYFEFFFLIIFNIEILLILFEIKIYWVNILFLIIYIIEIIFRISSHFIDKFSFKNKYNVKFIDMFLFNCFLNILINIIFWFGRYDYLIIFKLVRILSFLIILRKKKKFTYFKVIQYILFKSYFKFIVFMIITFFTIYILSFIYFLLNKNISKYCVDINNKIFISYTEKDCLQYNWIWRNSKNNFNNPFNSMILIFGMIKGYYINSYLSNVYLNVNTNFLILFRVFMFMIIVIIIKYYLLNILINYYENYFYNKNINNLLNKNYFAENKNYFKILDIIGRKKFKKKLYYEKNNKDNKSIENFNQNKYYKLILIVLNILNLIMLCFVNNLNYNKKLFIIFEILFFIIFFFEFLLNFIISYKNGNYYKYVLKFYLILNICIIILFILKQIGVIKILINCFYLLRIFELIIYLKKKIKNDFFKMFIYVNFENFKIIYKFIIIGLILKIFIAIYFSIILKINLKSSFNLVINIFYQDNFNYLLNYVNTIGNSFFYNILNIFMNVIINIIIITIFMINIIDIYIEIYNKINSSIDKLITIFFNHWNRYEYYNKGIITAENFVSLIILLTKNTYFNLKLLEKENFSDYKEMINSLKSINLPLYKNKFNNKFYIHFIDICNLIISKLMDNQYDNFLKNIDKKIKLKIYDFWFNKFNNLDDFNFEFKIEEDIFSSYYLIDYFSIKYIQNHYKINTKKLRLKKKLNKNKLNYKNDNWIKEFNSSIYEPKKVNLPRDIHIEEYLRMENQNTNFSNKLEKYSSLSLNNIIKINSKENSEEKNSFLGSNKDIELLKIKNKEKSDKNVYRIKINSLKEKIPNLDSSNEIEREFQKIKIDG